MEIKVSEIMPEGKSVELEVAPEELSGEIGEAGAEPAGEPGGDDVRILEPILGKFRIKKTGSTVTLFGEAKSALGLVCARCGREFRHETESSFEMDLVPFTTIEREEEKELQSDEMDVDYYKDDTLDLGEILREQVLLQAPMKPLCSEDCKGLCQYCRQDLNIKDCGCVAPTGHPGLAVLKDLLKDNK